MAANHVRVGGAVIPYGRQTISEADIAAVTAVLRSDWLTTGPAVEAFEKKLCELTGAKHAIACSNGTAALHLACMALGVGPGNTGVTTPLTFVASANCIEYCGGTTRFADIDDATLCLSPRKLEKLMEQQGVPTVVVPVDFAGVPADLPAIHALAAKYGFAVIEDAAHALGSTYECTGTTCSCGSCTHSDMATFSFHPVKTITCGEGGAVTTNSDELALRLRRLRTHGITKDKNILVKNDGPWYYEMHETGYNYRLSDIQCALGLSQLDRLAEFKARRQEIVKRYTRAFSRDERFICPPWPNGTDPCFHLYVLRCRDGAAARAGLAEKLAGCAIGTQVHYAPVHLQPYYTKKYGYAHGMCPAAETFYTGCLSLPLFAAMRDEDVALVIEQVCGW